MKWVALFESCEEGLDVGVVFCGAGRLESAATEDGGLVESGELLGEGRFFLGLPGVPEEDGGGAGGGGKFE